MKIKMLNRPYEVYEFCKKKVNSSIRLEIMATFLICFLSSIAIGNWYSNFYLNNKGTSVVDYKSGIDSIKSESLTIKDSIDGKNISISDEDKINNILNINNKTIKVQITDLEGKVLYKTSNTNNQNVDIFDTIKKEKEFNDKYDRNIAILKDSLGNPRILILNKLLEYVEISPLNFSDSKAYMIVTAAPKGSLTYTKNENSQFTTSILEILIFIMIFYIITGEKMSYLETISEGLIQIAKGNLFYRLKIQGKDELSTLSNNINLMAGELSDKIEKEKYAENTKNELITNVSHDLRTPLTSIKGYIGLLKDNKFSTDEELFEYLNIAYNKSEKLERLINDLFEYTKLTNKSIELKKENILLNQLLEQLVEELYVICKENNVEIKSTIPNEKIYSYVDGEKIVRVFENLLTNAIRYSPKNTQINLTLSKKENKALVCIENKYEDFNEEDLERIFDRFYRTDKSRSESDKGSGLGLSIAKSIVDIHGGKIWAEYKNGAMMFFVSI